MKRNYKNLLSNLKKQFFRFVKLIVLLAGSFFLILYFVSQPMDSSSQEGEKEPVDKEAFLLEISPYAKEFSRSHGTRPSILIAQAALESNWGNSQLAQESNNYFGIKSKKGRNYQTKEFQQNEWKEIKTNFKEYDSVYESVLDYADLLKEGTSWNKHLYEKVIQADSYQEAAYALTQAGYATDPSYAEKLIRIIEQYQLDQLD
ncbi:MAG: glycoside hydrolase family 73 protein [Atopostipes suicloacalis]|nr:glycoside hydrolase family 73 protein [Atopostipes suicloacalis]